jgi:penicillin-binding protein 2
VFLRVDCGNTNRLGGVARAGYDAVRTDRQEITLFRDQEHRSPMSPQLAIRVAAIGFVAIVMFGALFLRLWSLQVLHGDKYLAQANNNRVRRLRIDAPRGTILDRNGTVIVDNSTGNAVVMSPEGLPRDQHRRSAMYTRLARTLGMDRHALRQSVKDQLRAQPFSPAMVKDDARMSVVAYISERAEDFPGVEVRQAQFRHYPRRDLAAQLVGYVGQVSEEALQRKLYPGARQGDRVGIAGIESSYDKFLRGRDGVTRVQVDSMGNPHGALAARRPVPGRNLKLSLDLAVQQTGQDALAGAKGAFVVMDVKTGAVRALGSSPSFDPNVFSRRLKQSDFDRLQSDSTGAPLLNRATTGQYPTGSTFKVISAVAALQSGQITPDSVIFDSGSLTVGNVVFKNSGGQAHGPVALRRALQVSSDVFFYTVGRDDNGTFAIQKWAQRLGLGHPTGIDVPGEGEGLVPTERWRNRIWAEHGKRLPYRPWSTGDNVNLAVGQGDLLADPLQMAVAYAAVANGGYVVTPRLGQAVEDASGATVQEFPTPRRRRVDIPLEYRQAITDGLYMAAERPGGTSYPVFRGFPIPVAGKTGTAQRGGDRADQSWYVVLAPYPNPRYVVAVTSEAGGFGAETAAPAACRILTTLLDVRRKGVCSAQLSKVN